MKMPKEIHEKFKNLACDLSLENLSCDGEASQLRKDIMKLEIGTERNPVRYEIVDKNDPNRKEKLAKQREQFEKDANAGKVLCLSDLICSHGM